MGRKDTNSLAKTGERETSVADVLRDAESTDFNDRTAVESFESRHHIRLHKDPRYRVSYAEEDVLHQLAKGTLTSQQQVFVVWLIRTHRQLLECKTNGGYTPLHKAILEKNNDFVGLVLNHAEAIKSLLGMQTDLGMTSLHFAIDERSPFTEAIIAKVQTLPDTSSSTVVVNAATANRPGTNPVPGSTTDYHDIFAVKSSDKEDFDGMTPLHVAVTTSIEPPSGDEDGAGFPQRQGPNRPPEHGKSANPPSSSVGSQLLDSLNGKAKEVAQQRLETVPGLKPLQRVVTSDRVVNGASISPQVAAMKSGVPSMKLAQAFDLVRIVKTLIKAKRRVLVDLMDASGQTPFQAS
jgi:hypothetical protein